MRSVLYEEICQQNLIFAVQDCTQWALIQQTLNILSIYCLLKIYLEYIQAYQYDVQKSKFVVENKVTFDCYLHDLYFIDLIIC